MRGSTALRLIFVVFLAAFIAGCPPPKKGGSTGGRDEPSGVDPKACGEISGSKVGRKLYAFLAASAELDRSTIELEGSVKGACKKMAHELGVSEDGDTKTVCDRALAELDANLEISVSTEKRLVTRYTPPECTTDIEFTAGIVAECEASVSADVDITCEGYCGGTCEGTCDGTCAGSTDRGGECNGQCDGTCQGRCTADCQGYAEVNASAECEVSAEIQATTHTECTEPKVEIVEEEVTVVDDTKFKMAMAAIDAGMPTLLRVGAKAELVGKAIIEWVKTLGSLVKASGQLVEEIGEKGLCVGGQLAAALAASVNVQARIEVSIEVSASASASAGAQPQ